MPGIIRRRALTEAPLKLSALIGVTSRHHPPPNARRLCNILFTAHRDAEVRSLYLSSLAVTTDKWRHTNVYGAFRRSVHKMAVNYIIIGNQRNGSTPTFVNDTTIDIRYIIGKAGDYQR